MPVIPLKRYLPVVLILFVLIELILYIGINKYLNQSALDIVESWYSIEKDNLESGNYLQTIARNKSYLVSSSFARGLRLERKGELILDFGEEFKSLSNARFDEIIQHGFFSKVLTKNIHKTKDITITFLIAPPHVYILFFSISLLLLLLVSLFIFYLINSERKHFNEIIKLKEREREAQQALFDLTRQVAHDIRSPLAALEMAVQDTDQIREDSRLLIRSATNRIQDIANDLLKKKSIESHGSDSKTTLLSSLLNSLISEKRLELKKHKDIDLLFPHDEKTYGLFAIIEPKEFKRILSNLINNAAEAILEHSSSGTILVSLQGSHDQAIIKVSDDGVGMSARTLEKIKEKGFSAKKSESSGLGLYHAEQTILKLGGQLSIKSSLGQGTEVSIYLAKAAAPTTFVKSLNFKVSQQVVIVDDDESVHLIWKERLKKQKLTHFYSLKDFEAGLNSHLTSTILIDYEFKRDLMSGLDFIERHHLSHSVFLITSHFEDNVIQARCQSRSIGLIDKSMAPYIPIKESLSTSRYVLIDDDKLIGLSWKKAAKNKGVDFSYFASGKEFLNASIPQNSKIFLDLKLAEEDGLLLSQELFNIGYKDIHLATGYRAQDLIIPEHISSVIGKTAPF